MTTKLQRLQSTIPSLYNPTVNKIVLGVLTAWANEDENLIFQIANAKEQIFVETAVQSYLTYLGLNVGVDRPLLLAISDSFFRSLIEKMSFAPKQVRKIIYDILDIFWGTTFSRANITSTNTEPYNLYNVGGLSGQVIFTKGSERLTGIGTFFVSEIAVGNYIKFTTHDNSVFAKVSNVINNTTLELSEPYKGTSVTGSAIKYIPYVLNLQIDGVNNSVALNPSYFSNLTTVSAQEIVNSWNSNDTNTTLSALRSINSPNLFLNLRTNTPGMLGSINVTGGNLNTILGFPTGLNTIRNLSRSTSVYEINPRELVIRIPDLVAQLHRGLKGAIHLYDDTSITIKGASNTGKIFNIDFANSVATDSLIGQSIVTNLFSATIIGNTFGQYGVNVYCDPSVNISSVTTNKFLYQQKTTNSIWSVNHGFTAASNFSASQFPIVNFYNQSQQILFPTNAFASAPNIMTINWSSTQLGYAFLTRPANTASLSFGSSLTWTVNHNLGDQYPVITVYDTINQNKIFFPNNAVATTTNQMAITFSSPVAGRVSFASGTTFVVGSASTTWNINHNLNSPLVNLTIYDSTNKIIQPISVTIIDNNNLTITFSTAQSGRVSILGGPSSPSTALLVNTAEHNSYVYDTKSNWSLTGTKCTLNQNITSSFSYSNITVTNADSIPNQPGYLMINLGLSTQESPIRYLGKKDNTHLYIDSQYVFQKNHSISETINLLSSNKAYVPRVDGSDYAVYITGTQDALALVQGIISQVKAAGVVIRWIIDQPEDLFKC